MALSYVIFADLSLWNSIIVGLTGKMYFCSIGSE
jgi:hypothetical protein